MLNKIQRQPAHMSGLVVFMLLSCYTASLQAEKAESLPVATKRKEHRQPVLLELS